MEQLLTNSESAVDWQQLRPVLDEALDSLEDEEREALLLRYLKNQDYRAVGLALGVSDDAAQKRVSRAVERVREFFAQRGAVVGASGLVAMISANAVQAAPAGLAATISTAAISTGTAVTASTAIATTKAIVMTTLQKTFIAAALTTAIGAGIFEAHQAAQLRAQNQILQQQQMPLAKQIQDLQNYFANATNRLADLLAENSRLKSNPLESELLRLRGKVAQMETSEKLKENDSIGKTAAHWAARANEIKEWISQRPEQSIPESRYLQDFDYVEAARPIVPGPTRTFKPTTNDLPWAASYLRGVAKERFAVDVGLALAQCLVQNKGKLPDTLMALKYPDSTFTDEMLSRYQLLHQGNISELDRNESLVGEIGPIPTGWPYDKQLNFGAVFIEQLIQNPDVLFRKP